MTISIKACVAMMIATAGLISAAAAQEIRFAKQPQINNLPSIIVEQQGLFEKHAARLGAPQMKSRWNTFANGSAMIDAVLSDNVEFVSAGLTSLAILWSKTKGDVKGVSGVAGLPLPLLTRNPQIKSLGDFTAKDRIAVPVVKVSNQAVMLSMALEKLYGPEGVGRLDQQTVQLGHPDAFQALMNPQHEVNSHFSTPPYSIVELKNPNVHLVFSTDELSDAKLVNNIMVTTTRIHDQNPIAVEALVAALDEANDFINGNKRKAAEIYLEASGDKLTVDEVLSVIDAKGAVFSTTPQGILPIVQFMHRSGLIQREAKTWNDLFFPEIGGRNGS